MDKIHYGAFQELFKALGVNPFEFRKLNEDKVEGHFPDIPSREAKVNIKELSKVIWGGKNYAKWRWGR